MENLVYRIGVYIIFLGILVAPLALIQLPLTGTGNFAYAVRSSAPKNIPTSEEEKLLKDPNFTKKIVARFPQGLKRKDKAHLKKLIDQSLNALRGGDTPRAQMKIKEFGEHLKKIGGEAADIIEKRYDACVNFCRHHADEGSLSKYEQCFWFCMGFGPPDDMPPQTEQQPK